MQEAMVDQVLDAFDAAWSKNDLEGIVALFAEDATLESPLVAHLLKRKEGVCRGRDQIRELVRILVQRGTPWGGHEPPLIRGNTVAIEFLGPRTEGAPFYSVDVIEITNGKIHKLRAYLGWRAIDALNR